MMPGGEKKAAISLAAAGAGIVGASVVFGLTTDAGAIDWVSVVMAIAGFVMVVTGLFRAFGRGTPHVG